MRAFLPLVALLLAPAAADARPRLELTPALRAFIDLRMVEATEPRLGWQAPPREPIPPAILGGPSPADPTLDQGYRALAAFQYGLALVVGMGVQGSSYQDRSVGELPGLVRNADVRGGWPVWSKEQGAPP